MKKKLLQGTNQNQNQNCNWITKQVDLDISLTNTDAIVTNSFVCKKFHKDVNELVLIGKKVSLLEVKIDGKKLSTNRYNLDKNKLIIKKLTADKQQITIKTKIFFSNATKEGMFLADKKIFTINGRNSFIRMTYFFDDPHLQLHYSCRITASKEKFPHLLSDGTLVDQGEQKSEHWALWKSCCARDIYQFSLVAGKFFVLKENIIVGKKNIEIAIYFPDIYQDYCNYALECIKQIMQFDYEFFKLTYYNTTYKVVALKNYKECLVEGKELNIFDIESLAVTKKTTCYIDNIRVACYLAKKYFFIIYKKNIQNQDWFHRTFYHSFALFRLQAYIAEQYGGTYQSIEFVKTIRDAECLNKDQFLAPIEFFKNIDKNYYKDYYRIIRVFQMLSLGIGKVQFYLVLSDYYQQGKKQETTLDSFLTFLQANIKKKMPNLEYWFTKNKIPQIKVLEYYNKPLKTYQLLYFQIDKDRISPQQKKYWTDFLISYDASVCSKNLIDSDLPNKKLDLKDIFKNIPLTNNPFYIFLIIDYRDMDNSGGGEQSKKRKIVEVRKNYSKDFIFYDSQKITPFLNYGLIAPVDIDYTSDYYHLSVSVEELDQYTSWYLYYSFFIKIFTKQVERYLSDKVSYVDDDFIVYLQKIIIKSFFYNIFIYQSLNFPTQEQLFWQISQKNTEAIYYVRNYLQRFLGQKLVNNFVSLYQSNELENAFSLNRKDFFRRLLRNICLEFIAHTNEKEIIMQQYKNSKNFEDIFYAIKAFNNFDCSERSFMLEETEKKWQNNRFLFSKWFILQATANYPAAMDNIEKIAQHPQLYKKTYLAKTFFYHFAFHNFYHFHHISGRGYDLLQNFVINIDRLDASISCNLVTAFAPQVGFSSIKEQKKRACLENILSKKITRELNKKIKNIIISE